MTSATITAIKTLRADGTSPDRYRAWPMPTLEPDGTWTPGEWVVSAHATAKAPTVKSVNACAPAVYGCLPEQVAEWVDARAFWAEFDGAVVGESKIGAVRGRLLRPVEGWTEAALQAWAFWCADRAVRIHAVTALRTAGFNAEDDTLAALPEIVDAESAAAAGDTAWAADRVAARDAAGDAAWAVGAAAGDAAWAAGDAARAAAWDAAGDAAGAARAAEQLIQSRRLCEMTGLDPVHPDALRATLEGEPQ